MQVEPQPQPQRNEDGETEHGPGSGIGPTITKPGSGSSGWSNREKTVSGIIVGAILLALAITGISELSGPKVKNEDVQYQYTYDREKHMLESMENEQPQKMEILQLWADRPTGIQVYDWAAEDGDIVQVNGVRVELKKQPAIVSVQYPDALTIVGIDAGKDGHIITVSVIDELGDEAQYSISRGQVITVPTVPVWGR